MESSFDIFWSLHRQAEAGKEIKLPEMTNRMRKNVLKRLENDEKRSYRVHKFGKSTDELFHREEEIYIAIRLAIAPPPVWN